MGRPKTDLAGNVRLEPLPPVTERFNSLGLKNLGQTLGFILTRSGTAERSTDGSIAAMPFFGFPMLTELPFGATNMMDLLESLYMRPDVRAAIISNSRAFAELLSRDEQANKVFNDLIGGLNVGAPAERLAPLVLAGYLLGAAAAGAIVGWTSRP